MELPLKIVGQTMVLEKISVQWLEVIFPEIKGNVAQYFWNFNNIGDLQSWISEQTLLFDKGQKLTMVILNSENQEFLGIVSLNKLGLIPEIGVWIKENSQNQGYATKALNLLISWYKKIQTKNSSIRYLTEVDNLASKKLAIKLGFEEVRKQMNHEKKVFIVLEKTFDA